MPERPNIPYVFADRMSACWTGCDGDDVVRTPYLNRFASQAARFTNALTSCPLCTSPEESGKLYADAR